MALAFLVSLAMAVAAYFALVRFSRFTRLLVASLFLLLFVGFAALVISVGDEAPPGSRTITKEELQRAAGS